VRASCQGAYRLRTAPTVPKELRGRVMQAMKLSSAPGAPVLQIVLYGDYRLVRKHTHVALSEARLTRAADQ